MFVHSTLNVRGLAPGLFNNPTKLQTFVRERLGGRGGEDRYALPGPRLHHKLYQLRMGDLEDAKRSSLTSLVGRHSKLRLPRVF